MANTPEEAKQNTTAVTESDTADERPYSAEALAVAGIPDHHDKQQHRAREKAYDSNTVVAATKAAKRAHTEPDEDRPHAAEAIAVAGTPKNNWFPPLDFWDEEGPHTNPVPDATVQLPTNSTTLDICQPEATIDGPSVEGHQPVTGLWSDLVECFVQRGMIHSAVRQFGEGLTPRGLSDKLFQVGITDNPTCGSVHRLIRYICEGHVSALFELRQHLTTLGAGHTTTEDMFTFASLLRYADTDATGDSIHVWIDYEEFTDMTLDQREDVCRLWRRVSNSVELTLVTSRVTEAYLRCNHNEDLGVSRPMVTGDTQDPTSRALNQIEPDSTELTVLREIVSEPGRTMSYDQLDAQTVCSRSRLRQCLSQALEPLGLVKTYARKKGKLVTGLPAATTLIAEFESEYGVQSSLSARVNQPPNTSPHTREPAQHEMGEKVSRDGSNAVSSAASTTDEDRPHAAEATAIAGTPETDSNPTEDKSLYKTVYMSPSQHAAIVGAGSVDGRLTLVDTGIDRELQNRNLVSVSHTPREVAVSVPSTTPLSYIVGFSIALASPLCVESALTDTVLDTVIDDTETEVLRRCRQIGVVSADGEPDAEAIRDGLLQWGDDIANMTRKLRHGEYGDCDDRSEFLSKLMRNAHGLAGNVIHLLDMAGFDIARDIRVSATLSKDRKEQLAESIAHSLMIQSEYESHTGYRKLIEDREDYRKRALDVEVNADEPTGSVIGGAILRGKSAQCMASPLQSEIAEIETHDDAPEFNIPIGIQTGLSREDVAVMASRMGSQRQLRMTRGAVSVLHALVTNPFALTAGLAHLASADGSVGRPNRPVEPRDIRFALQQIDSEELLADLPRSAGAILSVLLEQHDRLSGACVARRAGVSAQTVRNHKDGLEALGIVDMTDSGMCASIGGASGDEKMAQHGRHGSRARADGGVVGYPTPHTGTETPLSEAVETAVGEANCGHPPTWRRVAERLAISQSHEPVSCDLTESPHQTPASDRDGSVTTLDSRRQVAVSVGPAVCQEPITAWAESPTTQDGLSAPERQAPSESDTPTSSHRADLSERELDFSGVEIDGAMNQSHSV